MRKLAAARNIKHSYSRHKLLKPPPFPALVASSYMAKPSRRKVLPIALCLLQPQEIARVWRHSQHQRFRCNPRALRQQTTNHQARTKMSPPPCLRTRVGVEWPTPPIERHHCTHVLVSSGGFNYSNLKVSMSSNRRSTVGCASGRSSCIFSFSIGCDSSCLADLVSI